jgi:hypothetical protein
LISYDGFSTIEGLIMKGTLSCIKLLHTVRNAFSKISDKPQRARPISLVDNLMSGFAVFSLKYPSLLQFDHHSTEEMIGHNLQSVYKINHIPSDTQMRERLDEVEPDQLRKTFKALFAKCQRSSRLELFKYYDDRYLMPLDGTGYFFSQDIHCDHCCEKHHRDGSVSYYHQMLSGAIVHPDQKVVLPFAPEAIMKSDGSTKNDCERRSAERFLDHLKREHPHLRITVTGDSLFSNGPFIKRLKQDSHAFILVAKPKNHKALFEEFKSIKKSSCDMKQNKVIHHFEWINGLAINDSHPDCLVNVLEYWEEDDNGKRQHWVWVTDFELNDKNVYQIMRGGRARHKIENETFNTLKNQGYQFEHNFGHGKKHLSTVFAYLMMLAFFVDQLQQLGCKVFSKALARLKTKKSLWERKRSLFFNFFIDSLDDLWSALAYGHRAQLTPDTS